jgi:predicted GNAT family N-acyltransferase
MEIKEIRTGTPEYDQMVALRMRVLLDPIGVPRSYIDPVRESRDILLAAIDGGIVTGCCILTEVDAETIQLRQMAVDDQLHRKGVGASIVAFAEDLCRKKGYRILTMNARDVVIGFYEKCGYSISSEQFLEVGIPHHKMQKAL